MATIANIPIFDLVLVLAVPALFVRGIFLPCVVTFQKYKMRGWFIWKTGRSTQLNNISSNLTGCQHPDTLIVILPVLYTQIFISCLKFLKPFLDI